MSSALKIGVERLINNLAIEHEISRDQAIGLVATVLQVLKRAKPTPPDPTVEIFEEEE